MTKFLGDFKFRIRLVSVLFFIIAGLLLGRLFFVQVVNHDAYNALADGQYTSYKSKPSIAVRGNIYFKEKNNQLISAATLKEGFLVAVNSKLVTNPEETCRQVGEIVSLDEEDCIKRAGKINDPFEVIDHRLDLSQANAIENMMIEGVNIFPEQWRFNPGNSLASHVLGFVGYKGDELVGRYGLEQYYEDILRGEKESLEKGGSFAALFFELGKDILSSSVYSGHDLVLAIEPRVQSLLEEFLEETKEKWEATSSGGIIMDPQTGAVIAMANKPDFDPNVYNTVEDLSLFRNPLISNVFEMGSVFKPLTLAAALDAGKITPETTYFDNGYVVVDNQRIENYDSKARGQVDMQAVFNESLNTGAVFAMRQLGKPNFREYMFNYGLAEKTGIDLEDEVEGQLANLSSPREIEYATAAFGQGIAITPIEFATAVSTLANGGFLVRPYIVERIIVDGGKDNMTVPVRKNQVLKQETSEEITRMLVKTVDEALLGGTAKLEHYSIAAKTGTAQIPKETEKGYYEDQYFHSFFGYAPAFNARFLIFLYLEKPQGVRYAAYSLTPPFMELMKFLLNYYEIPPDR